MYMDKMYEFSDEQSFAALASGGEAVSDNIVYVGLGETDAFGNTILAEPGNAGELIWHTLVSTTHAGSSASIVCELITKSTNASMSTGGTILDTFTIANGTIAGTHYQRPVPMEAMATNDDYMAVLYRSADDQTDALILDSWIGMDRNLTDSGKGIIQS
jgi:hypothetical protein